MNPDEFALKQFQQTENGETGQTEKAILSRKETYKSGRVVVPDGFGITKGF